MVSFWGTAAAAMSAKLERLRDAERALLDLAIHSSSDDHRPIIASIDTPIPVRTIHPSIDGNSTSDHHLPCLVGSTVQKDGQNCYVIHSISVSAPKTSLAQSADNKTPPLVLLHGYMNGGAYFYRNFVGLSRYFPQIYAIDQLGWGLSSRPRFSQYFRTQYNYYSSRLLGKSNEEIGGASPEQSSPPGNDMNRHCKDTSHMVHTAESFFVESLEVWRKIMGIESMVLAGHSMGGLLAVAYAERYPQHVHHLVLISPVGVPEETAAMIEARAARTTWRLRLFEALFPYVSPGDILRWLPESMGRNWIRNYVTRRLPAISDPLEQEALTEYLYSNNGLLPGSGEYCLPKLLKPSVFGRQPLQYRIPRLQVPSCSFLYGDSDWMDSNGGLYVEHACAKIKKDGIPAPTIDVYQVSQAGHLLMLENHVEFNNGLIWSVISNQTRSAYGGFSDDAPLPTKLLVNGQILKSQEQPRTDEGSNAPPMLDSSAT